MDQTASMWYPSTPYTSDKGLVGTCDVDRFAVAILMLAGSPVHNTSVTV